MLTRFDVLLIVLIVLAITGWPTGFANLPQPLVTIAVIVILLVLLLLGVVRY